MKIKKLRLIRQLVTALGFFALAQTAHAALIVQSAVSGGGPFHYEFSVANSGPTDVVLMSLNAPTLDPLIAGSLVTPSGFSASYDSILGIVDFFEDTALFAIGTTFSGFGFDSNAGPVSSFFDIFTELDVTGQTLTGRVNRIPEPTTLALIALIAVMLPRVRGQRVAFPQSI